jgi:hypothetical protein
MSTAIEGTRYTLSLPPIVLPTFKIIINKRLIDFAAFIAVISAFLAAVAAFLTLIASSFAYAFTFLVT